jgi:hypothetical protein
LRLVNLDRNSRQGRWFTSQKRRGRRDAVGYGYLKAA